MRLIIAVVFALLPAAAWADCNRYVHEFHDEWMLIDEGIQIIEYNRSVYGTIYDTGGAGTGLPFRAALPFQADDEDPSLYRHANVDGREAIIWDMMIFYQGLHGMAGLKQIEHDRNVSGTSTSARVHRVSHRLGVLLAAPILALSFGLGGYAAYLKVTPPAPVTDISDVRFYTVPRPTVVGDMVVFADGSNGPVSEYLAIESDSRAIRHRVNFNMFAGYSVFSALVAAVLYALARAFGWVVAGATRDSL